MFEVFSYGFAASLFLLALSPWVGASFIFMGFFGVCTATQPILAQSIFQVSVPDRLLGRVVSLWMLSGGLGSMSALPLGALSDLLGMRWVLGGTALILAALTAMVAVLMPSDETSVLHTEEAAGAAAAD
jgi:MFS family permease